MLQINVAFASIPLGTMTRESDFKSPSSDHLNMLKMKY